MSRAVADAIAGVAHQLDARVLDRLGGDFGVQVRAVRAELSVIPVDKRRMKRAVWFATVRAPIPQGFRGIHPTWIEEALDRLPERARRDLASGGMPDGAADPVSVWLVRRACAGLPPMAAVQLSTEVGSLDAALGLPASVLESWLENVGAEQVALLAIASKTVELALRGGPRLRAAVKRIWPFFRKELLGTPLSAIAERCKDTALEDRGLLRIGARAIAPHVVARPFAVEQLACRLPYTLGTLVMQELRAHGGKPASMAPTWRVLSHVSVMPP